MSLIITTYPDGRVAWHDSGLTLVMTRESVLSGTLTYAGQSFELDVSIPAVDPQDPLNGWKRRSAEQRSGFWRAKVFGDLSPVPPKPPVRRKAG